jgi:hypothetical protein
MGDSTGKPLLSYTYRLFTPHEVEETLSIYDGGSVWYWSVKAPTQSQRNRAGTFKLELKDAELAAAKNMAGDLVKLPPQQVTQARNAIEVIVTASWEGDEQTHVLSASPETPLPPLLSLAHKLGEDLKERAVAKPLSVVRFQWELQGGELRAGEAATAVFKAESVGVEQVSFLILPETLSLYARSEGQWEQWWQSSQPITMGFMDSKGKLLDGIFVPADIKPGATGKLYIVDLMLEPPRMGSVEIGAKVEGYIALVYPEGSPQALDAGVPQTPFLLESDPIEVSIS